MPVRHRKTEMVAHGFSADTLSLIVVFEGERILRSLSFEGDLPWYVFKILVEHGVLVLTDGKVGPCVALGKLG